MVMLVAGVNGCGGPTDESLAVKVYEPVPVSTRLVNVATPLTTVLVVVPLSVP